MSDLKALFEKDAASAATLPDGDKLTAAQDMARDLYNIDLAVKDLERQLEDRKKEREEIVRRKLPGYFDSIGVDHIGLAGTDSEIIVENYYHANIPDEHAEEAYAWLEEHDHGDLIKTVLTVQFQRGELETANLVASKIEAFLKNSNLPERPITVKKGVAWNTLTAFVKEQIEQGAVLPLQILGATVGRIAKIKSRSKGKRK